MSNLFKDRFKKEGNEISFDYEIVNGEVIIDEDTHYGTTILSDEETESIIRKHLTITNETNEHGFIEVYDDVVKVERIIKK